MQATGPDSIASAISEAFASGGKTAVADAIAEAAQSVYQDWEYGDLTGFCLGMEWVCCGWE